MLHKRCNGTKSHYAMKPTPAQPVTTEPQAQHSPLPWHVATIGCTPESGGEPAFPGARDSSGLADGGDIVCEMMGDSETCKANSSLIVRAVNAHAPLVAALALAKEKPLSTPWSFQCPQCGGTRSSLLGDWGMSCDDCEWAGIEEQCTAPASAPQAPVEAAPSIPVEAALRARVAALEDYVREIVDSVTEEPKRYEGDNHVDSFSSGWEFAEWFYGKKARDLLAAQPAPPEPLARPDHVGWWWYRANSESDWSSLKVGRIALSDRLVSWKLRMADGAQEGPSLKPWSGQWLPNPPPDCGLRESPRKEKP